MSPLEQRQSIEAASAREGFTLLDTYHEPDVSGGAALAKRPGLSRAVAAVEAGEAEVIVVAFFDRLVRSLAVQREILERVEKAGGKILAVDVGEVSADTASRWLSSTMLGMVAEYHRRVTAERTEGAKRQPPRWLTCQTCGSRRAASAAVTGRPRSAQHGSCLPCVQTR